MQASIRLHIAALLALLSSACAVELIDDIIAERGVTECSTGSTTIAVSMSTDTTGGTSTGTSAHGTSGTTSEAQGSSSGQDTSASESSSGGPPGPICGDAFVEGDEECDDGNPQNEDGCRNDCTRVWFVFITSYPPSINGDINGISGADYECRHRATKAFLPNGERYKAWLSTSTVQPVDRMYHARGPYVRLDGLQVAADWDALTSGTLDNPINVDENGENMEVGVWTGTTIAGTRIPNSQHCSDWEYGDSDQTGWVADSTATDALWTHGVEAQCGAGGAIYCFEQP